MPIFPASSKSSFFTLLSLIFFTDLTYRTIDLNLNSNTLARMQAAVPTNQTYSDLTIRVQNALTFSPVTIIMMKNDIETTFRIVIPTGSSFVTLTHDGSIEFLKGDLIAWKIEQNLTNQEAINLTISFSMSS